MKILRHFVKVFSLAASLILGSCSDPIQPKRVGIDKTWTPQAFPQEINELVYGFTTELLTEISKIKRLHLELVELNWNDLEEHLKAGKVDAVATTTTPHTYNELTHTFSRPFLTIAPVLVVPKTVKVRSIANMKGKKLGILQGQRTSDLHLDEYNILTVEYDSYSKALLDVSSAIQDDHPFRIDGALVTNILAYHFVRNLYQSTLKVAPLPLLDEGIRLASLKGPQSHLITQLDDGIKELKRSGKYGKLLKKWNLHP